MAENSEKQLFTPASKLAPKSQYFNMVMDDLSAFSRIVTNATLTIDFMKAAADMQTQITIAKIINPVERERILKFREDEERKIKQTTKDEKIIRDKMFQVNMKAVGLVMELYDDVIGLVERQIIMPCSPANNVELEMKFYPERFSKPHIEEDGDIYVEDGSSDS